MDKFFYRVIVGPLGDFLNRLLDFLPNLFISIIILIIGITIGWLMKKILIKTLHVFSADKFSQRVGITDALRKGGVKDTPSNLFGRIINWVIVFIFIIMSLYALRIPAIENLLESFFLYLPNVFVAIVLVVFGYILSNFLSRTVLIASVNAGIRFARWIARIVKTGVMILVITMALEQLGIGKDTVIIAFSIVFGGMIFALSLAFGLAGKDLARDFLERTIKGEEEKDELKHL